MKKPVTPPAATVTTQHAMPSGGWRWLLGLSLAANLLIAGIFIGHFIAHPHWHMGAGMGPETRNAPHAGPLIPGRFLENIQPQRRDELLQGFKANRMDMDKFRSSMSARSLRVADQLDKQPFDGAQLNTVLDEIIVGPDSMANRNGATLKAFFAKLTPEERQLLAREIRDRAAHQK